MFHSGGHPEGILLFNLVDFLWLIWIHINCFITVAILSSETYVHISGVIDLLSFTHLYIRSCDIALSSGFCSLPVV